MLLSDALRATNRRHVGQLALRWARRGDVGEDGRVLLDLAQVVLDGNRVRLRELTLRLQHASGDNAGEPWWVAAWWVARLCRPDWVDYPIAQVVGAAEATGVDEHTMWVDLIAEVGGERLDTAGRGCAVRLAADWEGTVPGLIDAAVLLIETGGVSCN